MKSKALYPALFSRHAEAYERRLEDVMARGEARGRQRVLDLVDARPGMRVLDLACGPGTLSVRMAPQLHPGGCVLGVDLARGMIERARMTRIPNAFFAVMDMELLALRDASFDAAMCGHGLEFVPELDRALAEARRVLRPRAVLAASVPVAAARDEVRDLLGDVIERWLAPAQQAVDQETTRRTVVDAKALADAARRAGFSSSGVEVVDERSRWESAEQLVALTSSWWDCASRIERSDPSAQAAFANEALRKLKRRYPESLETSGRTHVLYAEA